MATSTLTDGQRLTAAVLRDAHPKGEIARGYRSTAAGPTSGTTELPILRIDNVALEAGRAYLILVSTLRIDMSVGTDHFKWHLRLNTAGTATVSSTPILTRSEATADLDTMPPMIGYRRPSSAETGSFLVSLLRTSGTGTATAQMDDDNDLSIVVIDLGVAVADTGVVL